MTIRITKLAVVGRLIQLCLTALCVSGIRALWVSALPVRIGSDTYIIDLQQMDPGEAAIWACLITLGIVLVWGAPSIAGFLDRKEGDQ